MSAAPEAGTWAHFIETFFRPDLIDQYAGAIGKGVIVTCEIAVLVVICGLALGMLLAIVRSYRITALSLIIVGVGFLKANISTVVGALYEENDPRRDGGFTIFYVGINLGSFLATIACSYLGIKYGWAYGFGLAGIGMLFGLLTFVLGQSWLCRGSRASSSPPWWASRSSGSRAPSGRACWSPRC
mgnify:CR=1 FL=1